MLQQYGGIQEMCIRDRFNAVNEKEFKDMFENDLRRPWTVEEFNEKN